MVRVAGGARPTVWCAVLSAGGLLCLCPTVGWTQNLVVDAEVVQLSGVHHYETVRVVNGGIIRVVPYDNGPDRVGFGNLQLVATSIFIDEDSGITADGAGYQPVFCGHGAGPHDDSGGRGGCAVMDSGGGGAHFGRGGRGTRDNPRGNFPWGYEEDCGVPNGATGCRAVSGCRDRDGLPSVAGVPYPHSIYEVEFGAAGGDRGCLDGDGWSNPCMTAGAGGGRIVLAAVAADGSGSLEIRGRVSAEGWRGCGNGNDSGGGGGGGTVVLAGDQVVTTSSAYISAGGGLGGDTLGTPPDPSDPFGQACPACAQRGGTCDDCGGGGGGGIISVLSGSPAELASLSVFNVAGAGGGTCTNGNCIGEAGGGAGELQLNLVYRGEYCDGYDNDFDGDIDEDLQDVTCGHGDCEVTVPGCDDSEPTQVVPHDCVPLAESTCQPTLSDTRSRFLVIVDSSGSMLLDPAGEFTFGDGSLGHEGVDTDGNGVAGDDSRLYQAKEALTQVISAYIPDIDFGLARFSQGTDEDVNCQLAHWFECAGICCTYDDPTDNSGTNPTGPCFVDAGAAGSLEVLPESTGDECINYAGSCGSVRRGADILAGFQRPVGQLLMWLDHLETNFINDRTEGDHCDFSGGGDCELRATGPTPLADALHAAKAWLAATAAEDVIASCRDYSVILLTDGTETCFGDPVAAAGELLADLNVETYVIGFSVLASERAALDGIAHAGSASGARGAFFAGDEDSLATALASIVAESVAFELCNGVDDDCDTLIDEDFPLLGEECDDGQLGPCRGTGQYECRGDGAGVECVISSPGGSPSDEECNGVDDNCNGQIDEGLSCHADCEPDGDEVCDGKDNNCNGAVDEDDPLLGLPCGEGEGLCSPGLWFCVLGDLMCLGAVEATSETCNGLDDDCDGAVDNDAECPPDSWCILGACRTACQSVEFPCPGGYECEEHTVDDELLRVCMPGACLLCTAQELCVDGQCVDPCDAVSCNSGETCVLGVCRDCHTLGCSGGEVCYDGSCLPDPCAEVACDNGTEYCDNGRCVPLCHDRSCPAGQRCGLDGTCEPDLCAGQRCDEGEQCVGGSCVSDPCSAVYCAPGAVCVPPGECVPDPCPLVSCSADSRCEVVAQGEGVCKPLGSWTTHILATGAGGCMCHAAPTPATAAGLLPWGTVLLVLLFVTRRRGGGGGP